MRGKRTCLPSCGPKRQSVWTRSRVPEGTRQRASRDLAFSGRRIGSELWVGLAQALAATGLATEFVRPRYGPPVSSPCEETDGHAQQLPHRSSSMSLPRVPFAHPIARSRYRAARVHEVPQRRSRPPSVPHLRSDVLLTTRQRLLPASEAAPGLRPVRQAPLRGPLVRVAGSDAAGLPRDHLALARARCPPCS